MEIEGNDGSKIRVKPGSTTQFGRGHGFNSTNQTVSRRHVTLQIDHHKDEPIVHFEVNGKNPIWVHSHKSGKVETFRRFEKGEMENGDMLCVSAEENPIWFTLKKVEFDEENEICVKRELGLEKELAESLESIHGAKGVEDLDIESVDISNIDPVKEFGLVVMGHEFDGYAKKMIRDARKWQWFVDEPGEESEDDDGEEKKGKKRGRRKTKKSEANDDEEWTGESEEEKEQLTTKSRKVQKPVYSTRSKDRNRPSKDRKNAKPSGQIKSTSADEEDVEDENEDEDDETLGGFIVDDVPEEDDEMDEDDEEEDEFIEDEDEE